MVLRYCLNVGAGAADRHFAVSTEAAIGV